MAKRPNPVIEVFLGVKIKEWNEVSILLKDYQYKKLLKEAHDSNQSLQKTIAYSGQPCERCKGMEVQFLDKDGILRKIKRGILQIPESNGTNIFDKIKKENGKSDSGGSKNK